MVVEEDFDATNNIELSMKSREVANSKEKVSDLHVLLWAFVISYFIRREFTAQKYILEKLKECYVSK